ncbi:solute carrier family 23 protein [Staphylococcus aureus]
MVLNKIVGRTSLKSQDLINQSLVMVFLQCFSIIGGPPSTTYGENISIAITRIYSISSLVVQQLVAIVLAFIGKFTALISSIPTPVMGGVSILLFGIIAASGLRMLVESKVQLCEQWKI